jgi:hypothetical protein
MSNREKGTPVITREQYIAGCDQELAMVKHEINRLVAQYADNMDHVNSGTCCDEVDNIAGLAEATYLTGPGSVGNGVQQVSAYFAVAVKMIYDARNGNE